MSYTDYANSSSNEIITVLLLDLLMTSIFYLAYPIWLIAKKVKLSKREIRKKAIWNSVIVYIIFTIIHVCIDGEPANMGAAAVWFFIVQGILNKFCIENTRYDSNIQSIESDITITQDILSEPAVEKAPYMNTDMCDVTDASSNFVDNQTEDSKKTSTKKAWIVILIIFAILFVVPVIYWKNQNTSPTYYVDLDGNIYKLDEDGNILYDNTDYKTDVKETASKPVNNAIASTSNDFDELSSEQIKIANIVANDSKAYCKYIIEIERMLSKGTYGESIKKDKVIEYLNNLPLDYGQRTILFRMQFMNDTTYCADIVEYLNERDDISYDDAVFVLEELGFAVFEDGTVKW